MKDKMNTVTHDSQYEKIAEKINAADAILIGASNGLSITEGIHLFANNEAMRKLFGDLQQKYGLQCLLHGMMAKWPSAEQMWGFWSRMINHYCADYTSSASMQSLKSIIGEKDYFIVTSNGEQHFELAGFDEEKIFEVEGDWLHMVCSNGCNKDFISDLELVKRMAPAEQGGVVPSELIPRCPHCGAPMIPSMAAGFINEKGKQNYKEFLRKYHGRNLVILELGIGARNQLIKAPLMRLTAEEEHVTYITINLGELYIQENIKEKSFGLDGYIEPILEEINKACETN